MNSSFEESQQLETPFDKDFYLKLSLCQEQYKYDKRDGKIEQLVRFYADCIYYFEKKGDEVSEYFKQKIKKVLLERRKMNKQNEMEQQIQLDVLLTPIMKKINQHKQCTNQYQLKINSIITTQKKQLVQRKLSRKKQINSISIAHTSINSSFQYFPPTPKTYLSFQRHLFQDNISESDKLSQKYD